MITPIITICGRPNVGKSTLFNRLLGKKKALVSDIPGLTRDFREERISLHGKDFLLIDTAGVYESNTDLLSKTIENNSLKIIHESDLCLFVLDGKAGITNKDIDRMSKQELLEFQKYLIKFITIFLLKILKENLNIIFHQIIFDGI